MIPHLTPDLSFDLEDTLAQLSLLDDAALWRTARTTLAAGAARQLEELHLKRQREGLAEHESQAAAALVQLKYALPDLPGSVLVASKAPNQVKYARPDLPGSVLVASKAPNQASRKVARRYLQRIGSKRAFLVAYNGIQLIRGDGR